MSTGTTGSRIGEERARLGVDQSTFGAWGGVTRFTQANYEQDKRVPDATYLAGVAEQGVDVAYVVTGKRSVRAEDFADDIERVSDAWETLEMALVQAQRTLTPEKKRRAAEALYKASKHQVAASREQLMTLVMELVA